ncbi:MAG: hypothetical protein JOZ36_06645 [Acidobacteria bacterium]|nr:hypothetical protein [Acidobacteriota bacterium]
MLRYLAQHAVEHPGTPLKEYQIATEVFGRPTDFDPHLDSAIRVQAGRWRMKLAEYYAVEGSGDPLIVELPKGTYVLNFYPKSRRKPIEPKERVQHDRLPAGATKPVPLRPTSGRRLAVFITVLLLLLIAAAIPIILLLAQRRAANSSTVPSAAAPTAAQAFWRPFVDAPDEPWVVFSNGAFIGRPETGMRYFDPRRDAADKILDHYTGVGEVLAIHELDRIFSMMHRELRVKRGSLLSLDDAKNKNLIFVGSPAENLSLLEMPGSREFVFRRVDSGRRKGDLGIFNVHPQAGEPLMFLATPGPPLIEDYATITLTSGLNPGRHMLILGGTTTLGTQAAVEFVCRDDSLAQLLLRLSVGKTVEIRPFEAVLRVKVTRGVPVETHLVSLRKTGL